jgi:hypothetical protein
VVYKINNELNNNSKYPNFGKLGQMMFLKDNDSSK